MGQSYGFCPAGYNQIVVFSDAENFKKIVAANPNMTAIMGADDHTAKSFPGVFLAGIKATQQTDILVARLSATQRQRE